VENQSVQTLTAADLQVLAVPMQKSTTLLHQAVLSLW
jgi:hypothetical protein